MNEPTTVLFRPVGPRELDLLKTSGWRRWPPRLQEQPIFYPATNEEYAIEIASQWNVQESGCGYVTRFRVTSEFISRYTIERVGAAHHTEWWIPAEDLEELNDNIVGLIEVVWSSDSANDMNPPAPDPGDRSSGDETLRVRFEGPSNGWLVVATTAGEEHWEVVVSYTPNDFLLELVTALLSCAEYENTTFVAHANAEPDVYLFTFLRRDEHVSIAVFEKASLSRVFSVNGTFKTVVVPFWRALRRLQTTFIEHQWQWSFPQREMAALTAAVDDRKTSAG